MALRESRGDMYPCVTHTWNTIKGRCEYECKYCFMRRYKLGIIRLDKKELKADLGESNIIFVGSSCDMWSDRIPTPWIEKTLKKCSEYPDNKYLFQSKNPGRFEPFIRAGLIPKQATLCTTIESNVDHEIGYAPTIDSRKHGIIMARQLGFKTTITIEPIMEFSDTGEFLELIDDCGPEWVTVGADSQRSQLPEPCPDDLKTFVTELKKRHAVVLKKNLDRLFREQ